jgi:glycosyltransferase involved in cell wall biosynthesis
MKIGVVITTFNKEDYFQSLYDTIPFDRVDSVVVVNGGEKYQKEYKNVHWIQHDSVKYASVARNDGLKYLIEQDCDYYFVLEDDLLIKSPDIFEKYIRASKSSGLQYLCFKSNAWNSGEIGNRTPVLKIQSEENGPVIDLMQNTCNEMSFRTKYSLEKTGLYDERLRYIFDIDMIYRLSKDDFFPFWYFPDISDSDDLVMNNPVAVSRINANGEREKNLQNDYEIFKKQHGCFVNEISVLSKEEAIEKMRRVKENYGRK